MASLPVDVLGAQAGAGAVAAASVGAAGAGAGGPRAMRRIAQLVSDGSRPNKVFKDKDVNHVAKTLKEYSGKDHPKDAEFLNCPIRFYTEMESIFSHAMATGRFALASGEALGANQADSIAAKVEGPRLDNKA
ncbi:unnamed protein product [Miscanthus lutarioriparius]|uniref:Uncharacterized protein n=1 Tax=Miscanthus lutarioriparius TaxID=422564 RepID=A0A811RN50_9POAL|nr:unnamed protein product [Miscanthus lutarioriparius]